ncbi:protein eds1-related [Citrus sinensis]|nr:protein eds1-related [Citrus sinensis]
MRKLEHGELKATFPKIVFNPSFEEDEEKCMDITTVQRSTMSRLSPEETSDLTGSERKAEPVRQNPTLPPPASVRLLTQPPPPPPPPPPSVNHPSQATLPPIRVATNVDHSMVWNEINDGSLRFDDEQIENLFGYSTINRRLYERSKTSMSSGSSNAAPTAELFILEPRKCQNTAIVLRSLAISQKEIIEALLDGQGLSIDILEKLAKLSSSQDDGRRGELNGNHILGRTFSQRSKTGDSNSKSSTPKERDNKYLKQRLPAVEGLSNEFNNVNKAVRIELDTFINTYSALASRVVEIWELVTHCASSEKGGFLKEMKGLLEECKEELKLSKFTEEEWDNKRSIITTTVTTIKKSSEIHQLAKTTQEMSEPFSVLDKRIRFTRLILFYLRKGREEARSGCIVGGLTLERALSLTWIKVKVESTIGKYPKRSFTSLHNNFQERVQNLKQETFYLLYDLKIKRAIIINQAKLLNREIFSTSTITVVETMASERLGEVISMKEEVIKNACSIAMKAHKLPEKQLYLVEKNRGSSDVIFSFPGSWTISDWFSRSPFGEKMIDPHPPQFASLRSIGNDQVATVNEAFLTRFQAILPQLQSEVVKAVADRKQIVFTGHSSAGPIAVLMTVWFLENWENFIKSDPSTSRMPPICVTFGSPLVGDFIINHALRRESWSHYFIHFVMRYDIVPRVLLAPLSSLEPELKTILDFLNPKCTIHIQEPTREASALYVTVMRNASSVASHAACHLMGNTNKLSDTLLSFIELSPYRPFGTYVFCTGDRELVVMKNPDAVLQILFYSSQLSSEVEGPEIALRSVKDHFNYQSELQNLETKGVAHFDNLEGLPLSSNVGAAGLGLVLNNLGLSTRARLCLCAAGELEKQKRRNQDKINKKKTDIEKGLLALEGYKTRCEAGRVSYYDALKLSKDTDDFNANVRRLELAGIFDEIMEMLKRYELPDEFEGHREWINIGTRYRRIVEPLDIANYYRHLKNEDTGPYMKRGRPKRYRYTQRWLEYALKISAGSSGESCFWARIEDLCLRTINMGLFEDVKEEILSLEKQVEKWVQNRELGDDIFFEDSTFVKWWKKLPQQHRSGSCISKFINN